MLASANAPDAPIHGVRINLATVVTDTFNSPPDYPELSLGPLGSTRLNG